MPGVMAAFAAKSVACSLVNPSSASEAIPGAALRDVAASGRRSCCMPGLARHDATPGDAARGLPNCATGLC